MSEFSIVIPAHNEASTIGRVVETFSTLVSDKSDLIVIDNESTDRTAEHAAAAKATVICAPRIGKGYAVRAGLVASRQPVVFFCDADVQNPNPSWVRRLTEPVLRREVRFARGKMRRDVTDAPVTNLTAKPLLRMLFPEMIAVEEPLGGIFAVERDFALAVHLPGGWGVDVTLTIEALRLHGRLMELDLGRVTHRRKPLAEYCSMAEEVTAAILACAGLTAHDRASCAKCQDL
jgi:glucosyl-3-phosphoglycerate synthase